MAKKDSSIKLSEAIHKIQLSLLYGPCTGDQLFAAGSLLSRPDYEDVVVERSISDLCGHPICANRLPSDRPRKGRYRISLSEHKVYDLQETYNYCSDGCVVRSRAFSGSLKSERCDLPSSAKISEILGVFESQELGRDGDFGFSKLTIHEKSDTNKGEEVLLEEWIGPSNAIEGYVPQRDRSQGRTKIPEFKSKPESNLKPLKSNDSTGYEMGFTSMIIIGDPDNVAPSEASSVSIENGSNPGLKKLEDGVHVDMETKSMEPALRSSLKSAGAKAGNRSVKWADEKKPEVMGDEDIDLQSIERPSKADMEDADSSSRLSLAEACAAALTQAAEAVASGQSEAGDAVAEVGIVILPPTHDSEEGDLEADENALQFDRGIARWPAKPVILDTDMFDVEDSWHDTPPEGFSLTLSPFATMWMALFGWITCSSLAYIYGRHDNSQDDFLRVNGCEYPRKIVLQDGRSSEIKQTLAGCMARALPGLVTNLRLPAPISTMEQTMGRLLDTMSFNDALPPLKSKQWHVIALLFIDALSVHRIPSLTPHMTSRRRMLHKVLSAAGISGEEYETMKDLILPLGRLPQFSVQCGG